MSHVSLALCVPMLSPYAVFFIIVFPALAIGEVVYGCKNPHFGGNGTILSVHETNKLYQYKSKGGVLEKEGISVLQEFYEIPNMRVPEPLRKSKPARKPK